MGLDTNSNSSSNGSQSDSLILKAAGDLQAGQLNNQAFADDITALYTRDQGQQDQLKADLMALNQKLQDNNVLPNLVFIGGDGQGDMFYGNPDTDQISLVNTSNKQIDGGSAQDMLAKYSSQQNQAGGGDQGGSGSDQSDAQAQGGSGSDQSNPQAQGAGQDQSLAASQGGGNAPGGDQAQAGPGGTGSDQDPNGPQAGGADRSAAGDQGQSDPAAGDSGQAETWGLHGRKYTSGNDGGYTHVVEEFQGADKPGDTMYRIASDSLEHQHGNDPNYQPSEQDVAAEIKRIAAYNKDDGTIGQPPEYMIKVGETIKIPPQGWVDGASVPGNGTGTAEMQTGNPDPGTGDSPAGNSSPAADDSPAANYSPAGKDSPAANNPAAAKDAPASDYQPEQSDSTPTMPVARSKDTPAGPPPGDGGYGYQPGGYVPDQQMDPGSGPRPSYPGSGSYVPQADNAPAPVYAPTPGYPDSGSSLSDATNYGFSQPGAYGQPSGYDQSSSYGYDQPSGYGQPGGYVPDQQMDPGSGPRPTYAQPYGYPQGAYEVPPYEYPAPYIAPPRVQTEIYVNPFGLARDIERLVRR